jgi:hypothetical protein
MAEFGLQEDSAAEASPMAESDGPPPDPDAVDEPERTEGPDDTTLLEMAQKYTDSNMEYKPTQYEAEESARGGGVTRGEVQEMLSQSLYQNQAGAFG